MYQIYVDNSIFCDSRVDDLAVINPKINLEVNKAGSCEFIIPPQHPYYSVIKKRMSLIRIVRDEQELFEGICTSISDDFFRQRTVKCEGVLSFFNDTIQRPHRYQNVTVRGLLEAYVARHNSLCEASKHFTVGMVTVTDSNNSIYCYTNYETTMECLKDDLVGDLGGYLRVRTDNGIRYLDYLADSPNTASQSIILGENLIDFDSTLDTTQIATVIIPLGATLEESSVPGLDERVGIASVNDGKDYIVSESAVENFGWIEKVVIWDSVTKPENLKRKAEAYLSDTQFENMVIEAKAVDLHLADPEIESFKIMDKIHILSTPHGLNRYFILTKQTINLNKPESDTITLGSEIKVTLTAQNREDNKEILKRIEDISVSSILESAKDNASEVIKNAGNGYVTISYNENMNPYEILIMDKPTKEEATKVWRWNVNGLGYSDEGYDGTYGLAMTMDGKINADFITTGDMTADRIKGGILTLGGADDVNGLEKVLDAQGREIVKIDKDGILINNPSASAISMLRVQKGDTTAQYWPSSFTTYTYKDGEIVSQAEYSDSRVYIKNSTGECSIQPGQLNMNWYGVEFIVTLFNGVWPYIHADGGKLDIGVITTAGDMTVKGNLVVVGTKPRIVDTENYGTRYQYCYEMPSPMFGDIGSAKTDEEGICYIYIDDIFGETVDCEVEYQVFLQKYGDGDIYVAERQQNYFVVKGTPNLEFGWELKAVQRDYDSMRLELYEEEENEELEINHDNN